MEIPKLVQTFPLSSELCVFNLIESGRGALLITVFVGNAFVCPE